MEYLTKQRFTGDLPPFPERSIPIKRPIIIHGFKDYTVVPMGYNDNGVGTFIPTIDATDKFAMNQKSLKCVSLGEAGTFSEIFQPFGRVADKFYAEIWFARLDDNLRSFQLAIRFSDGVTLHG